MTVIEHEVRNAAGMTGDARTAAVSNQQSLIIGNEVRQWIKEGRVFQGGTGVLSTPEAENATALTRQQPNFMVRVPASMVIIPVFGLIAPEATGAAVYEVLISCCNNDPGTANRTAIEPVNVNTRYSLASSRVLAYKTDAGASGTAPTGVADLLRLYNQADFDAITGAPTPPTIYSPRHGLGQECVIGNGSSVNAFMAHFNVGTSATFFSIFTWAEFTYAEYYGA
ncbi:hypothetical protein LCGC14_0511270 [marine sediment metagenome]|uniref:Uncharacterized protein n=1 Tax=marine sediment metagenome TaxID=412755 RepID=A0A0F9UMP3_9ZZZZ